MLTEDFERMTTVLSGKDGITGLKSILVSPAV